jgi:hypothetical protein
MPRCSCAGNSCSCTIQTGPGLQLTGTGNTSAPFTISLATQFVSLPHPANGTLTLANAAPGSITEILLSGNVTSLVLPVSPGARLDLVLRQTVAGRTVAWPSSIKWAGGAPPVLSTTAGWADWIAIRQLATDWIGVVEGAGIR